MLENTMGKLSFGIHLRAPGPLLRTGMRTAAFFATVALCVSMTLSAPVSAFAQSAPVQYGSPLAEVQRGSLLGANALRVDKPGDFPSWDEVHQAKENVEAAKSESQHIEDLISRLRDQAGQLGDQAVLAAQTQANAESALQASLDNLTIARAKQNRASTQAAQATQHAGQVAAQLYKSGTTTSGLGLLISGDPSQAIEKLNLLRMVSQHTSESYSQAIGAKNVESALAEQADAAQQEYQRAAGVAHEAATKAQEISAQADEKLQEQQQHSKELYEQLADLRGTSADLEQKRLDGLAQQKAYDEQVRQAQEEQAREASERQRVQEEEARRQAINPPTASNPQPVQPPVISVPGPVPAPPVPAPRPVPAPVQPAPVQPAPAPRPAPPAPAPRPPAPRPPSPAPAPLPVPPAPAPPVGDDPGGAQAFAGATLGQFGWGQDQFQCLVNLWNRESGWRTTAMNPYSGAYGIPQSLPGSKMASAGGDWRTNYRTQVLWGLGYIRDQYSSPCGAWNHSETVGWY